MSVLKEEQRNLIKQIKRTKARLREMEEEAWNGICCHSCAAASMFSDYWYLRQKQDRRRERLTYLTNKIGPLPLEVKKSPVLIAWFKALFS